MKCHYYDDYRCRSCTFLEIDYTQQLARLERSVQQHLPNVPKAAWASVVPSAEQGFRNKAKLAIGGRRGELTLGIHSAGGTGVDLRDCNLYEPGLAQAIPVLADWLDETGLTPYDIRHQTGEFKHLVLTYSPTGQMMANIVLRSEGQVQKLTSRWPELSTALPHLHVGLVSLLAQPIARLEPRPFRWLSRPRWLPMNLSGVHESLPNLLVGPNSFFQTNTTIAAQLYQTAARWVTHWSDSQKLAEPGILDLYCGVGGFGLAIARALPSAQVHGVESNREAVECAWAAAQAHELSASFRAADAETIDQELGWASLAVLNPPRRGIGQGLADQINASQLSALVYSSCNVASLAEDLAMLNDFEVRQAQVFDMFPHTHHAEVLVLATRR